MEPPVYETACDGFCQSPSYVDVSDEYINLDAQVPGRYKNCVPKKYRVSTSINQSTGKVR